jgi:ABC-type multidrug transport system permease subunit
MRSYIAYIRSTLRLTLRDRLVLFFGYVFPIAIFALFANSFRAERSPAAMMQVICMVLVLGVLGNGFFGGGMRATAEREAGILRRFKVAPITPAPILVSSMFTGWLVFLPSVFLFLAIGHFKYSMPWPDNLPAVLIFMSVGIVAFRSVGLIIASTVNSMAESQVLVQLLYLPMLMLSGATIPLTMLPDWLQKVAQFIPATHLFLGMQNLLVKHDSLANNLVPLGALALTAALCLFVSVKLFRWEKEEKVKTSAKLWILAVMAPFFVIGGWQIHSQENLAKAKVLDRELRRSGTSLIRNARLFIGDGRVIESGGLLVKNGRIEAIFEGRTPEAKDLNAAAIEAAGKTVIPGLIDTDVRFLVPGALPRALAAYLFSGVVAIRAEGVPEPMLLKLASGEMLGPQVFPGANQPPVSLVLRSAAPELLTRSLMQQVAPPPVLQQFKAALEARAPQPLPADFARYHPATIGTASGFPPLLLHGPMIHQEMQLWARAGVPTAEILEAATSRAAKLLGADSRLGYLRKGYEASIVLLEGNPLDDIAATERIYLVILKGERVDREDLFEDYDKKK